MVKVLWISDGGAHTGFSTVTHAIGDRLVDRGHEIHVLATNYRGDPWDTKVKLYVPTLHSATDIYGRSRFIEMLGKIEPDVVVVLHDPFIILKWLFENNYDPERYLLRYRPILGYYPVDGYNQPPGWKVLEKITNPVVMSKFGLNLFENGKLVYHGVDLDQYWKVSAKRPITVSSGEVLRSKSDCKAAFGYSRDSFLVLRVDRNSGRKDYPATWSALLPVMHRHSDVVVHFHCQGKNDAHGIDLGAMFSRDPETASRFHLPDLLTTFEGWSTSDLNALYNAADLFVTTSRGEGFGLTIAEAIACGVPVVAQNITAIPEVVGPAGVLVEPDRPITVPSGQDLWLADIEAFTEAIERLYLSRKTRAELSALGQEHVKQFSWDVAADRFHDYICALAEATGEVVAHGSNDT